MDDLEQTYKTEEEAREAINIKDQQKDKDKDISKDLRKLLK